MSAAKDHLDRLDGVKEHIADDFGWRVIERQRGEFLAFDQDEQVLWLKARTVESLDDSPSWDWIVPPADYDALIGILVSHEYELVLVIRVHRSDVERLKRTNQDNFRLRWNEGTRNDSAVAVLYSRDV